MLLRRKTNREAMPQVVKVRKGTTRATLNRSKRDLTSKAFAAVVFELFPFRDLSKLPKASEGKVNKLNEDP
jgi:hypothetical protein